MDATVLDPFAGSGAMGFESLSRGAKGVTFFDDDPGVLRCLRENATPLGLLEQCRIVKGPAERLLGSPESGGPFDLVLADPPYDEPAETFLRALFRPGLLSPGAQIVVERDARSAPRTGEDIKPYRSARYGKTRLDFYRG